MAGRWAIGCRAWKTRCGRRPVAACPLATGAALADRRAAVMVAPPGLGPVVAPLLVMPFIADVARGQGGFNRDLGRCDRVLPMAPAWLMTGHVGLDDRAARPVVLRPGGRLRAAVKLCDRAFVAPAGLQRELVADRTLAPATAESRARGAGGGDDSLVGGGKSFEYFIHSKNKIARLVPTRWRCQSMGGAMPRKRKFHAPVAPAD